MANFWKVNQVSTSGAIRYWDMIETMLAAGWTMPNAGDGTIMAANQVTHGGSGANGLNNLDAWVRLQDPAGGREITLQRRTAATNFIGKYSKADKFTGGAPSATVTPTATAEYTWSSAAVHSTATSCVHHCWASNVAPYPFYFFAYPVGGGVIVSLTLMDELQPAIAGVVDTDPVVIIRCGVNSAATPANLAVNSPVAVSSLAMSASGWVGAMRGLNMYFICGTNTANFQGYLNNNVPPGFDGIEDTVASGLVLRRNADSNSTLKGWTTNFLVTGRARYSGDTYTLVTARDKIYLLFNDGGAALPWNGDIPIT